MAGFKAHMAFGILVSILWTGFTVFLSLVTFWVAPIVFIAGFVGAFLPDLDSDTGKPLKILLTTTGLVCSAITALYLYNNNYDDYIIFAVYTIGAFIFVYFILGTIFKKLTHHRGIFHSVPATILSSLITLYFLDKFQLENDLKVVISLAVGLGYLSHLILDEINSLVNLNGIPFVPNKATGSALKLFSNNMVVTIGVYVLNIILLITCVEPITAFFNRIF